MQQKYFTPIVIGRIRFCILASTGVEWMTFNHGWRILATFLWIHLFVFVHCIDLLRTSHAEKKKLLSFNFKICLLITRQCRHKEREKPSSQFQISKVVSFHFTKAVVPLHLSSRRMSMANVIQIQLRWMYCANENPTHLPERAKKKEILLSWMNELNTLPWPIFTEQMPNRWQIGCCRSCTQCACALFRYLYLFLFVISIYQLCNKRQRKLWGFTCGSTQIAAPIRKVK